MSYSGLINCSSHLLFFPLQRGSGALPRSPVSSTPGCWGWRESSTGAWRCCSHHDVWQHLVHPAHGSEHDGRELPVCCCWPPGLGHVARSLLPERSGQWDWMKNSQRVGGNWVWVCFTGRQMFGWLNERQSSNASRIIEAYHTTSSPSSSAPFRHALKSWPYQNSIQRSRVFEHKYSAFLTWIKSAGTIVQPLD